MKRYIEFIDDAKTSAVEQLNIFLENLSKGSIHKVAGYQANTDCTYILLEVENELANQLDEPQPVKVPQCVADWIEYCKFTHVNLQHALIVGYVYFYNYANQKDFSKLKEFLETENNQEIFARAWLDGYEVEEEKKYFVKLKAVDQYLVSVKDENFLGFLQSRLRSKFTRKELEDANLGWVFSCEGIEIEEVD